MNPVTIGTAVACIAIGAFAKSKAGKVIAFGMAGMIVLSGLATL